MTPGAVVGDRLGVMQLVDTLDVGGAERVAVNLANLLTTEGYRSFLCTTRREGALSAFVLPEVGRLRLGRTRRLDLGAVRRLVAFNRLHDVRVLHAHGTALFTAALASFFRPRPAVVWHDHYGRHGVEPRSERVYRLLTKRVGFVISVTQELADWTHDRLSVRRDRILYLPNFVCDPPATEEPGNLPGVPGSRIVCVANFRPQKDHLTLVRAMKAVVAQAPDTHLLLVGASGDPAYKACVEQEIRRQDMAGHVTVLGQRLDVAAILKSCDVGVLSSTSEGLPLALIEYGTVGLPAVATRVGQCPDVLQNGEAGLLVAPSSPAELAEALLELLRSPERRITFGARLRARVDARFSASAATSQIRCVYETVLGRKTPTHGAVAHASERNDARETTGTEGQGP